MIHHHCSAHSTVDPVTALAKYSGAIWQLGRLLIWFGFALPSRVNSQPGSLVVCQSGLSIWWADNRAIWSPGSLLSRPFRSAAIAHRIQSWKIAFRLPVNGLHAEPQTRAANHSPRVLVGEAHAHHGERSLFNANEPGCRSTSFPVRVPFRTPPSREVTNQIS